MRKKRNKKNSHFKKSYTKAVAAQTVRQLLLLSKKEIYEHLHNVPPLKISDKLLYDTVNLQNSCLNRGTIINECIIPDAYMHTAYLLCTIIQMSNNNSIRDGLIFPALYSFRHYLELTMKDSINRFGNKELSEIVIERNHNLVEIWEKLSPFLEDGQEKEIVRNLIGGFNGLDPNGERFRYPYEIDADDKKIPNALPHGLRGIKELRRTMLKIYRYFDGINFMAYNVEHNNNHNA